MKTEAKIFISVALFFLIIFLIYWYTSFEDAGSVMLFFSMGLGALPGAYLFWWSRRMDPRPEDLPDATIASGQGSVGAFPEGSIWPFVIGLGVTSLALTIVTNLWMGSIGIFLLGFAIVGGVRESRRGGSL